MPLFPSSISAASRIASHATARCRARSVVVVREDVVREDVVREDVVRDDADCDDADCDDADCDDVARAVRCG
jgi:hypothetical protein